MKKNMLLSLALGLALMMPVGSAHAQHNGCRTCSGFTAVGPDLFFAALTAKGQPYAPGRFRIYTRKDKLCCEVKELVLPARGKVLSIDGIAKRVHVIYPDALVDGQETRGVLTYLLTSRSMDSRVNRLALVKQCKGAPLWAGVQRTKQRGGKKRVVHGLVALDLTAGKRPRVLKLGAKKGLAGLKTAKALTWAKDCKSFTYRVGAKKHRVAIPERPKPVVKVEQVRIAVIGKLLKGGQAKTQKKPAKAPPITVVITIEKLLPPGEATQGKAKEIRLVLKYGDYRLTGLHKIPNDAPVQALFEGPKRGHVSTFKLLSVVHR